MIPSDRPTIPPVAITILTWNFVLFVRFWKVGIDGRTDTLFENSDHYRSWMWGSRVDPFLICKRLLFKIVFWQSFDILCKGDHTKKLKLLYCLHLPGLVLPGELESPDKVDGNEVAIDATEFFEGNVEQSKLSLDDLRDHLPGTVGKKNMKIWKEILNFRMFLNLETDFEVVAHDKSSSEVLSLRSLQNWVIAKDTSTYSKELPSLPQKNFVHLWKTLQDMFYLQSFDSSEVDMEAERLYHAASIVGNLLLQIGEVGQKVTGDSSNKDVPVDKGEGWALSFQQFVATMLNESDLVKFFDKKFDICDGLANIQESFLHRDDSSAGEVYGRSVFYT